MRTCNFTWIGEYSNFSIAPENDKFSAMKVNNNGEDAMKAVVLHYDLAETNFIISLTDLIQRTMFQYIFILLQLTHWSFADWSFDVLGNLQS